MEKESACQALHHQDELDVYLLQSSADFLLGSMVADIPFSHDYVDELKWAALLISVFSCNILTLYHVGLLPKEFTTLLIHFSTYTSRAIWRAAISSSGDVIIHRLISIHTYTYSWKACLSFVLCRTWLDIVSAFFQ